MQVASYAGTDVPLTFSSLPIEMQRYCFSFLVAKELCKLNVVCSSWWQVCTTMDDYWENLLRHYIPKGLRLSSTDSFLHTKELSWKAKYKMLTSSCLKDVKFVFVGDSRVGKTKMIHSYLNFKYEGYTPTVCEHSLALLRNIFLYAHVQQHVHIFLPKFLPTSRYTTLIQLEWVQEIAYTIFQFGTLQVCHSSTCSKAYHTYRQWRLWQATLPFICKCGYCVYCIFLW